MALDTYLIRLSSFLVIIPAAVLCLLPMKNQFRRSVRFTVISISVLLGITLPSAALISCLLELTTNEVLLPILLGILYLFYFLSVKVSLAKSLAIFLYICAYIGIISDTAHGLTALSYIGLSMDEPLLVFSMYQLGMGILLLLLFGYPLYRYGSRLIDSIALNRVWLLTVPVSSAILLLCARIVPRKYETLYVNNVFKVYWALLSGFFIFLIFLSIIYYFMVSEIHKHLTLENRTKILEVQESLFNRTQNYLAETARARHDFKQTIYTLKNLADQKDLTGITEYLETYIKNIPQNEIVSYCKNNPLNAILNHYTTVAKQNSIKLNIDIDIPDELNISDVDLCSITGNILDNAVTAVGKLDAGDRIIDLIISQNHNSHIYIIVENRFNGKVKKKGNEYLSTNRKGNGIGLSSITSTAENYGGTARFYNDNETFYSEVML